MEYSKHFDSFPVDPVEDDVTRVTYSAVPGTRLEVTAVNTFTEVGAHVASGVERVCRDVVQRAHDERGVPGPGCGPEAESAVLEGLADVSLRPR